MDSVGIAQLKARLSEYLDVVRGGGELVVTDRGRPLARLTPAARGGDEDAEMATLERSGVVRRPDRQIVGTFWAADRPADPFAFVRGHVLDERS